MNRVFILTPGQRSMIRPLRDAQALRCRNACHENRRMIAEFATPDPVHILDIPGFSGLTPSDD
jgi:hypothetical protein